MLKVKPRSTYKVITKEVKIIRSLREKRALSVNKAALLIGTNKSTLTALENGRINLSEAWIEKILKSYKFNQEDFKKLQEVNVVSKDELLEEIMTSMRKLNQENILTISQLVNGLINK